MNYPLNLEQQRQQFSNVINYLISTGKSRREIATEIGSDNTYITKLCDNTLKHIPTDILEGLHANYKINPRYITHGASNMFDTLGLNYEKFDEFVDSWDLVDYGNSSYLHFFMDENFYDFLINIYTIKETSNESDETLKIADAFYKALKSLKAKSSSLTGDKYLRFSSDEQLKYFVMDVIKRINFSSTSKSTQLKNALNNTFKKIKEDEYLPKKIKEYVLIPVDTYYEILDSSTSRRKTLDEILCPEKHIPLKLCNSKKENGTD